MIALMGPTWPSQTDSCFPSSENRSILPSLLAVKMLPPKPARKRIELWFCLLNVPVSVGKYDWKHRVAANSSGSANTSNILQILYFNSKPTDGTWSSPIFPWNAKKREMPRALSPAPPWHRNSSFSTRQTFATPSKPKVRSCRASGYTTAPTTANPWFKPRWDTNSADHTCGRTSHETTYGSLLIRGATCQNLYSSSAFAKIVLCSCSSGAGKESPGREAKCHNDPKG